MASKKKPTIISFYTDTWEYPSKAESFIAACHELKIPYHVERLDDSGSWIGNTRLKSTFVYNKLEEFMQPVLWVDIDSTIYRPPLDLNPHADIGLVRTNENSLKTFYAGTVYVNYTEMGREFARRWSECPIEGSDHMALQKIWDEGFVGTLQCLSPTYCEIEKRDVGPSPNAVIYSGSSKDKDKQKYMRKNPRRRILKRHLRKR